MFPGFSSKEGLWTVVPQRLKAFLQMFLNLLTFYIIFWPHQREQIII